MSVITVSRQLASHGCEIAAAAASMLSFRFIDREIIHRAAEEAGVPKIALEELAYEGRRNLVERILRAVNAMPPVPSTAEAWKREAARPVGRPYGGIFSPAVPSFSVTLKDYVDMVGMVIRDLAREGGVVIVGRGSQVLLRDAPRTLHVQIVAPFDCRVETLAEREGIEEREASERLRASDMARREYLQKYHQVDWLDVTLYDLVINTHRIPARDAAAMIVEAYHRLVAEDHG
jgi:hypothetical protein